MVLPDDGPLADELRDDGIEVLIRELSVIRRELASPRGLAGIALAGVRDGAQLGRFVQRRRVALVHSNTSVVLGGAAAAAFARVPHIWHVREIYSRFGRAWPPYRRLLATATALPCVSGAAAAQFRPGSRVHVIHDGLAVDPRRAPRAAARAALELPDAAPVIAVLGRVSDWKGQDVLVRALAEPELRERGAIGLIAGEAWPGAESRLHAVTDLAERLTVADRVRLLGFRDDLDMIYGAADLIAVPSTAPDPLPGSAIEAAAAGCAVVASATGGLPEIINDGQTGRLVPPGDADALARCCAQLLDDPGERERLGSAAATDAHARFAPARLLEAIHRLYDAAVSR